MQAWMTHPPGGWEHSRWCDADEETGSTDRVLLQVCAVGLNPADAFQVEGRYPGQPKPPFVVGRDAAGTVLQADQQGRWKPGDAVIVLQSSTTDLVHGMLSERRWVSTDNLAPLPTGWNLLEGAAAPLAYLTAWKALQGPAIREGGKIVLVTGASGGVGLAAVQLARAAGNTVLATSRSADKRRRLLEQGANGAFAPDDPQLKDQLAGITGTKGVDLVVETVGGPSLTQAVHLLRPQGVVSVVGVLAGVEAPIPIPALMFKRATVRGILVTEDDPSTAQRAWSEIVETLQRSSRKPVIDRVFPAQQVTEAFQHLRGNVFGKVVVEFSASTDPDRQARG